MDKLEKELLNIYQAILGKETAINQMAASVHPDYALSAKNLYRYLILRSFDLRKVHDSLSEYGISSMRTAESYVWQNLTNAISIINLLQGKSWTPKLSIEGLGYRKSRKLLTKHANQLFNTTNKRHTTEIMVTMPTEASEDLELVRNLILAGMEIARINLSHDSIEVWQKMVDNLKNISRELNLPIKIYMDLSGPKIRTSEIAIPRNKKKKNRIDNYLPLKKGEHLILTKRPTKGKRAVYKDDKQLVSFAEVGITLPQIIIDLEVGDPIFFDDGMIEGRVLSKTSDDIELVITKTHKKKLKSRKGINLPETHLNLPSLTDQDIKNLPFVVANADIVGYSFVRTPEDVQKLYQELTTLKNEDIGVVFKIENKEAFENLSLILFEAMKRPKIG
ncbi:MAG: pyruvate kinase, partial [Saprospiraceae bacterium]